MLNIHIFRKKTRQKKANQNCTVLGLALQVPHNYLVPVKPSVSAQLRTAFQRIKPAFRQGYIKHHFKKKFSEVQRKVDKNLAK